MSASCTRTSCALRRTRCAIDVHSRRAPHRRVWRTGIRRPNPVAQLLEDAHARRKDLLLRVEPVAETTSCGARERCEAQTARIILKPPEFVCTDPFRNTKRMGWLLF
jgi:hypothetical protein